jgi:hypothetical protein
VSTTYKLLIISFFIIEAASLGRSQTPAKTPAQAPVEPVALRFGVEERLRSEDWNNLLDVSDKTNDQRDQLRLRTRIWIDVPVTSSVEAFLSIATEPVKKIGSPLHFTEVFFDAAYLDFHRLFVRGLDLKVGRQDIKRGEGFILFEGTPMDGSRDTYMNTVNLNYTRGKQKLELLGILDPSRDRFLPVFNNQQALLQNQTDEAVGAYYTNTSLRSLSVESYYFLKKEIHSVYAPGSAQFRPDRHVHTAGARTVATLRPRLKWTTEFARQWGAAHGGATISAWGGYSHLRRDFNRPLKPYLKVGYTALSGDDPRTANRIEGWDPIFSYWSDWCEGYVYSTLKEGYWSNLSMEQFEAGFQPVRKTNLRFTVYEMGSFHNFPGSPAMFGDSTHRGENYQVRADFAFSPEYKAHILWESHHPGDFYAGTRAASYMVQAQLTYSFSHAFAVTSVTKSLAAAF